MNRTARTVLSLVALVLTTGSLAACGPNVLDLEVGDCLNQSDLPEGEVTSVPTTECSEPHDAEVYGEVRHDDGEFPGTEAVQTRAAEECTAQFESFVGVPYAESELFFSTISPSQETWEQADDRTSLCILLAEEALTGSLAGADR